MRDTRRRWRKLAICLFRQENWLYKLLAGRIHPTSKPPTGYPAKRDKGKRWTARRVVAPRELASRLRRGLGHREGTEAQGLAQRQLVWFPRQAGLPRAKPFSRHLPIGRSDIFHRASTEDSGNCFVWRRRVFRSRCRPRPWSE